MQWLVKRWGSNLKASLSTRTWMILKQGIQNSSPQLRRIQKSGTRLQKVLEAPLVLKTEPDLKTTEKAQGRLWSFSKRKTSWRRSFSTIKILSTRPMTEGNWMSRMCHYTRIGFCRKLGSMGKKLPRVTSQIGGARTVQISIYHPKRIHSSQRRRSRNIN